VAFSTNFNFLMMLTSAAVGEVSSTVVGNAFAASVPRLYPTAVRVKR
jgi:hypothetical protein